MIHAAVVDISSPVSVPLPPAVPALESGGDPGGSKDGKDDGSHGGLGDGQGLGVGQDPNGCPWCDVGSWVSHPDQPPRLIHSVSPVYPHDAFVKKVEGTVHVEALIDATGHVVRMRVVKSVPLLDEAALECVQKWLFVPARHLGAPVATVILAPIRFSIY